MNPFVNDLLLPQPPSSLLKAGGNSPRKPNTTALLLQDRELFGIKLKPAYAFSPAYSPQQIARLQKTDFSFQHHGCVNCCNFNSKGTLLLSGSDDLDVKVWKSSSFVDTSAIELVRTIHTQHSNNIFHVDFSPLDDSKVFSGAADGEVRAYDLHHSTDVLLYDFGGKMVNHFAFADEHTMYAAAFGRHGGNVVGLDLRTAETERFTLMQSRTSLVKQVACCPWDNNLLAVGVGSEVHFYDLRRAGGEAQVVNKWTMRGIYDCERMVHERIGTFLPNEFEHEIDVAGMQLARAYRKLQELDFRRPGLEVSVSALQYSSQSRELLVSYQKDRIYRFSCEGGEITTQPVPIQTFCGAINEQTFLKRAAYFGPQEEYIVCGGDGGNLHVFASHTGALVYANRADEKGVLNGVVPNPSFQRCLVTYGLDEQAKLWVVGENQHEEDNEMKESLVRIAKTLALANESIMDVLSAGQPHPFFFGEEEPYKTMLSYVCRLTRMQESTVGVLGGPALPSSSLSMLAFELGEEFDTTLCRLEFCLKQMEILRADGNADFRAFRFHGALSKFTLAVHYSMCACALYCISVSSTDKRVKHMNLKSNSNKCEGEEEQQAKVVFDKIWDLIEICSVNAAAAALKLVPTSSNISNNLAKDAVSFCDQALLVNDKSLKARYRRYNALMLLGKKPEALLEMNRLKAIPGGLAWIKNLRS